MSKENLLLSGNYAAAYGAKLSQVEVIPIYPITPQTAIVEKLTEFVQKGELLAELIHVESEHSAMASAIAAEAIGARTFTASSSQGICYMHENLFVAAGLRMPMVMAIVNRAITMPISIGPDHGDALAQRDTAWLQFYAENAQEVLDSIIQAYKVAEDERVLLPVAVCFDGLIISHFFEPVEVPDQETVTKFLGEYHPRHLLLDPERPMTLGIFANEFYVTEYRYQQQEAMENAKAVIGEVDEEYRKRFGRSLGELAKGFMLEGAEIGIVAMGSMCTQIRRIVLAMREKGLKVGAIKMRVFRPFPREEVQRLAAHLKLLCVIDRDVSIGSGGILHSEVSTAVHALKDGPRTINFIMGLSGREVADDQLMNLIWEAWQEVENESRGNPVKWVGVRG